MIRQEFKVEHYWQVVIFYNLDYNFLSMLVYELKQIGFSWKQVVSILYELKTGEAKACTCSSLERHISIVLFTFHRSKKDYINSIAHEAEHIKQAMLKAYHVEDAGEPPAYTIGYLVEKMYRVFKDLICAGCI